MIQQHTGLSVSYLLMYPSIALSTIHPFTDKWP